MLVDPITSMWSDRLFQGTLVVLLLAMVFTSLEYAAARVARVARKEPATVGAGAEDTTGTAVEVTEPPADASDGAGDRPTRTRSDRYGRIGVSLMILAVLLHAGSIVLRGLATYRWPLGNMYEFTSALCLMAVGAWLVLVRKHPTLRPAALAAKLPGAEVLDRLAYRVTVFAFPLYTFGIITGAVWAEAAWGRFWGWDPKETVAFVAWVLYAAYLHARATAGWRSSRAAWINSAGFATIVFNLFFINMVVAGLHSYAGV